MKKFVLLFLAFITLCSCEDNVRVNNPAFQGIKDNVFWKAVQSFAVVDAGGAVTIDAYTAYEKVSLKISSTALDSYPVGMNTTTIATYVYTDAGGKITFSSGEGIGNGEIVITEYDAAAKTISGTFKFNLENIEDNPLAGPTLNFQQGLFYKVPIVPSDLNLQN